mgnify:CR=1 FL=1
MSLISCGGWDRFPKKKNWISCCPGQKNCRRNFGQQSNFEPPRKRAAHFENQGTDDYLLTKKTQVFVLFLNTCVSCFYISLCKHYFFFSVFSSTTAESGFSTSVMAVLRIGIRQFLLFPNSTMTSSSVMSMTIP